MNDLEVFCTGILSTHPPCFSYLFNLLFISAETPRYLFDTLSCYSTALYFLAQIILVLAIGDLLVGSGVPLLCVQVGFLPFLSLPPSFLFFLSRAHPHILELQDAPGSLYIFLAPVLESAIWLKKPGFFYWRMILETKIWVLCVLMATRISILDPLS